MSSRMPLRRGNWKVHFVLFVSLIFVTSVLLPVFARAENEDAKDLKLRDKRYYYKAFNRRDPFQSLIVGEFEESEVELIDVYSVRLVGVLTGGMERYAMLEDDNGYGYIVKTGDPIRNGSIVSVGDRSLVARVSMFGQTTSVTLRMED
jgi:hypothetical protein